MASMHAVARCARLRLVVACLALALVPALLSAAAASAANYAVTGTADSATPCTGTSCPSLRSAITAANATTDNDVINLGAGGYSLTLSGADDSNAGGDLDVQANANSGSLSIIGAGPGATSIVQDVKVVTDPAAEEGVIAVLSNASLPSNSLILTGVTLTGGDRATNGNGGGLQVGNYARSTLSNVAINGNNARRGGGLNIDGFAVVSLTDTTVSGNRAVGTGAPGGGAGIANAGNLTLNRVTISGNRIDAPSANGGGIRNEPATGGKVEGDNVTIANNAVANGGNGGGIYNVKGDINLRSSTIAGNGSFLGNGIYLFGGDVTLRNTLVHNEQTNNCAGSKAVQSLGGNLDRGTSCNFTAVGDRSDSDPRLGPLANNGGAVQTMALRKGSRALDGGIAPCAAVDARNVTRQSIDGSCDIGALEQNKTETTISISDSPDPVAYGGVLTYTITARNEGPLENPNFRVTTSVPDGTTFVDATSPTGSCGGTSSVACNFGTLAPGQSAQVVMRVVVQTTGVVNNAATAGGDTPEFNASNDRATAATVVTGGPAAAGTTTGGSSSTSPPASSSPPTAKAATTLAFSLKSAVQRRASILRARALTIALTANKAGKAVVVVSLPRKGKQSIVLGKRTVTFEKKGTKSVRIAIGRTARKALRRARLKGLKLLVTVRDQDADADAPRKRLTINLR